MQFLPSDISAGAGTVSGFFTELRDSGQSYLERGKDFLATLNQELAANGITPLDVTAGSGAPRHFRRLEQTDTVMDEGDIKALRDALKKRGLSESDLSAVDSLLEADSIPSMGALMATLMGAKRAGEALSDKENDMMGMLLHKLGFDQEAIASLRGAMERGGGLQALKAVKNRIDELPEGDRITVDSGEFAALLRGLDVTEAGRELSLTAFGGAGESRFSKADLAGLLARADMELTERENAKLAIGQELRAAMDEVLRTKKQRENEEPLADARGSRKADRAETRMKDDLSARSMGFGPDGILRNGREETEGTPARGSTDAARPDLAEEEPAQEEMARDSGRQFADTRNTAHFTASSQRKGDAGPNTRADETRGIMHAAFARVGAEGLFSGAAQSGGAQQNVPLPRASQEEIFAQVQKGLLRELSDGSRQLALRLDPAELGQVTVLLTVNKGDLKALFRVENAEVGSALSEQMAQLKASLEEQGFRVSQLDVQTQLAQDPSAREWAGTDFYNKEQELREQARFQRLAKMRRDTAGELAQDMQNESIREENSLSGLHIVA